MPEKINRNPPTRLASAWARRPAAASQALSHGMVEVGLQREGVGNERQQQDRQLADHAEQQRQADRGSADSA
jgi:hypothetical protein